MNEWMNLYVYSEYPERICMYMENTWNEINIWTKFCCSYSKNTRNESVRKLRIRRTDLYLYWEYAEYKFEYLGECETKIENISGCLSGA